MIRLARVVAAALVLWCAAGRAEAACTITVTGVAFGAYDVFTPAPTDSTGSVTYRCGNNDKDITITLGTGASGTFTARALLGGPDILAYNLYLDATRTSVWGDGTGGSSVYFFHNPKNNQDVVVPVYGRIPAGQDVRSGNYSDTLVVTIDF